MLDALGLAGTPQPSWHFRHDEALEAVLAQFGVATLEGFGIQREDPVIRAAGAAIRYLRQTQGAGEDGESGGGGNGKKRAGTLSHLHPPRKEENRGSLHLDAIALRALEVLGTMRGDVGRIGSGEGTAGDGSLVGIFADPGCRTAMGKRLLREWLCRPLSDRAAIDVRQSCVATLISDRRRGGTGRALAGVQDVPRMARGSRWPAQRRGRGGAGEVGRAGAGGGRCDRERAAFAGQLGARGRSRPNWAGWRRRSPRRAEARRHLREGGLVRDGVDAELDEAAAAARQARSGWPVSEGLDREARPAEPEGRVQQDLGYYIELPSAQSRRAPAEVTRNQTRKSSERYITPELREFERKVTTAETRAIARELAIFESLCAAAAGLVGPITTFADIAAELDVLLCFAETAARRGWARPETVEQPVMRIVQASHPVLDELLEGAGAGSCRMMWNSAGRTRRAACGTLRDHGPQHGGQEHVHSADCAAGAAGALWELCARRGRDDRADGSDLHARGRG